MKKVSKKKYIKALRIINQYHNQEMVQTIGLLSLITPDVRHKKIKEAVIIIK
jgi:hypothetical protein